MWRILTSILPTWPAQFRTAKDFDGSMGPKVDACIDFVNLKPGAWAIIADLKDAGTIATAHGCAGTLITDHVEGDGVIWRTPAKMTPPGPMYFSRLP